MCHSGRMQFWSGTAFLPTRDLTTIASLLDKNGFTGVFTSDHLIYPRELRTPYPLTGDKPPWLPETQWPDSWVTIGALAAVTTRLRFSNAVYIVGARPLLEVAKQVATAAALSDGRVSLAVGTGWMREEFELLGQDFDNRGPRTTEMIHALRALWQGGWVSWRGEFYDVPEIMIEPHPPAPVPILCGGESDVALKRAARDCDGWVGTYYSWDDAVAIVGRLKEFRRRYDRADEPFEVIVSLSDPPSVDLYRRAEDIGVTGVMCAPWRDGRYREGIERFADDIITRCG
nr:TIGR03619 family F420-dependent LLM class oxidoreductase [Mycolicibacterium chitae]